MNDLERQRVAVTVFAEVDAVDRIDAGHIVEHLICEVLRPGKAYQITLGANAWEVTVHDVMETGAAVRDGYLSTAPTREAFTHAWQFGGDGGA